MRPPTASGSSALVRSAQNTLSHNLPHVGAFSLAELVDECVERLHTIRRQKTDEMKEAN